MRWSVYECKRCDNRKLHCKGRKTTTVLCDVCAYPKRMQLIDWVIP